MIVHDDELCTLYLGDCVAVMAELAAESVDAIVTDPPYGLEFMGKEWDRLEGAGFHAPKDEGRTFSNDSGHMYDNLKSLPRYGRLPQMQAWHEAWAREAFRVAKPGAYLVAAGGTRTFHRLVAAIEDAGWEIRDTLIHCYASGFPKSLNVSAALRKLPACSCDVAGEVWAVEPGLPAGAVGAGVGTEARAVPLAGLPTDSARRVLSQASASADGRRRKVQADNVSLGGEFDPVVLGTTWVAPDAEGDEVGGIVGAVQVDPEALGDEMVSEQPFGDPAVLAGGVNRHLVPAAPLVAPTPATPSRIAAAGKTPGVVGGHANAGAVGSLGNLAGDDLATSTAGERAGHPPNDTTERPAWRCPTCGGVIQHLIPEGLGTALKPSFEPWTLARKPLSGTVAQTVLKYGTGALNIDATRIGTDAGWSYPNGPGGSEAHHMERGEPKGNGQEAQAATAGRWPANLMLTDPIFDGDTPGVVGGGASNNGAFPAKADSTGQINFGPRKWDDRERVEFDSGTYSRFFLIPKSSRSDREPVLRGQLAERANADWPQSLDGNDARGAKPRANSHPTVKPLDLMRHLVRLVTPPGGTVLDCFLGSGTTAIAANAEGFRCIGIEKEREYLDIALARMAHQPLGLGLDVAAPTRERKEWPTAVRYPVKGPSASSWFTDSSRAEGEPP